VDSGHLRPFAVHIFSPAFFPARGLIVSTPTDWWFIHFQLVGTLCHEPCFPNEKPLHPVCKFARMTSRAFSRVPGLFVHVLNEITVLLDFVCRTHPLLSAKETSWVRPNLCPQVSFFSNFLFPGFRFATLAAMFLHSVCVTPPFRRRFLPARNSFPSSLS